jgi:hypothetical protein
MGKQARVKQTMQYHHREACSPHLIAHTSAKLSWKVAFQGLPLPWAADMASQPDFLLKSP